jgi:hypothetical protein
LLDSEAGVCGKFNLSNCCLQIDDEGKVIEEITDRMISLSRLGEDGISMTCLKDRSLP